MFLKQFLIGFLFIVSSVVSKNLPLASDDNSLEYKDSDENENYSPANGLDLPWNASRIRENIVDTFSCENRHYGYYADVDNGCQVFHICRLVKLPDGQEETFRWSFICPDGLVFNEEIFTCVRPKDSIRCEDSPLFYSLNEKIFKVDAGEQEEDVKEEDEDEDARIVYEPEEFEKYSVLKPGRAPILEKPIKNIKNVEKEIVPETVKVVEAVNQSRLDHEPNQEVIKSNENHKTTIVKPNPGKRTVKQ